MRIIKLIDEHISDRSDSAYNNLHLLLQQLIINSITGHKANSRLANV